MAGVVAFVLSVLPSVAVAAWPFAAAATMLGTVGILRALDPHWMPPVGLALGATGWIVSVILVIVGIGG